MTKSKDEKEKENRLRKKKKYVWKGEELKKVKREKER